ncbi:MAG TPA: DegT/DnrJ/EryC1/StrS family aminotransferase [Candidatus Binatia bacterium]
MSSSSPIRIPIVDLRAQYGKIRDEVRSAIDEIAESQQFILGPAVTRFEAQMSAYLDCNHTVGVASGSDALLLALMALDIGPGDAVITTPFTFFSTVSAITRLGALPLFVDINFEDFLLSAKAVADFLNERGSIRNGVTIDTKTGRRIKALLPVHLFGQCCAMTEFVELARRFQLHIVEDVAQACGAWMKIDGKTTFAGSFGDLGCFSFFPSKNLGSFGDAGLVSTESTDLAARLRMLRMHGESAKYHHAVTGVNSRLDSLQAAILSVKLRYLETWCEARIERADTYRRLFSASGLVGHQLVAIPLESTDKSHVFNNYVIRALQRDQLKQFLADNAIQSEIYYPVPLHLQKCFADLAHRQGEFPQSELAANQVLALPLYPELTVEQQELVVATISAFYRR